jgi:hypothetical protein
MEPGHEAASADDPDQAVRPRGEPTPSSHGRRLTLGARRRAYHSRDGGARVTVWFTVQLENRPGSLARVATALADRGVNITEIVGVAEDTDGALMLGTSDPAKTREAFGALGIGFEEHDGSNGEPSGMTIGEVVAGRRG